VQVFGLRVLFGLTVVRVIFILWVGVVVDDLLMLFAHHGAEE